MIGLIDRESGLMAAFFMRRRLGLVGELQPQAQGLGDADLMPRHYALQQLALNRVELGCGDVVAGIGGHCQWSGHVSREKGLTPSKANHSGLAPPPPVVAPFWRRLVTSGKHPK